MKKHILLTSLVMFVTFSITAQTVNTAEEFVKAIKSNATVTLSESDFHVSKIFSGEGNTSLQECYDGQELVISDVKNLTISGTSLKSHLITEPRYGYVLIFKNCENITIENITAGHGPQKGSCTGGVFSFENCKNVTIDNCVLYGSGTEGLTLHKVTDFTLQNSVIKECTYSIISASSSSSVSFNNCSFFENQEFDLINLDHCKDFTFKKCEIKNNKTTDGRNIPSYCNYSLFNLDKATQNITLVKCKITGNTTCYFSNSKTSLKLKRTKLKNNTFVNGKYYSAK